jgi:hypothetical protein
MGSRWTMLPMIWFSFLVGILFVIDWRKGKELMRSEKTDLKRASLQSDFS